MSNPPTDTSLFERPPRGELAYCDDVMPIHRMLIRVDSEGKVFVRGQRNEIEQLIVQLRQRGLFVVVNYLSLCG